MIVQCDRCKEDFSFDFFEQVTKGGIKKVYIVCPHCKQEYVSFYETEETKQLKQKVLLLTQQLSKIHNPKEYKRKQNSIKKLKRIILKKEKLNGRKYESE